MSNARNLANLLGADTQIATADIQDLAVTPAKMSQKLTSSTAVSASGTAVDFTGIPSWVKRITVMFSGVSTSSTSSPQLQLGDSGGLEVSGYDGRSQNLTNSGTSANVSNDTGFKINSTAGSNTLFGCFVLTLVSGNTWLASGQFSQSTAACSWCSGSKELSDTLTQIRITTVNGTDTFDAGTINIMYEG